GDVPEADRLVLRAGSQHLAVRREGQGVDGPFVPCEVANFLPRVGVPEADDCFAACRKQALAVTREEKVRDVAPVLEAQSAVASNGPRRQQVAVRVGAPSLVWIAGRPSGSDRLAPGCARASDKECK